MLLMEDNLNELQMSKNRDKKIPITDEPYLKSLMLNTKKYQKMNMTLFMSWQNRF